MFQKDIIQDTGSEDKKGERRNYYCRLPDWKAQMVASQPVFLLSFWYQPENIVRPDITDQEDPIQRTVRFAEEPDIWLLADERFTLGTGRL